MFFQTSILSIGQEPDSSYYFESYQCIPLEWQTMDAGRGTRVFTTQYSYADEEKRTKWMEATGSATYQFFQRDGNTDQLNHLNNSSHMGRLQMRLVFQEKYPYEFDIRFNRMTAFQTDDLFEFNFGFDKNQYRELLYEKFKQVSTRQYKAELDKMRREYEDKFRQWRRVSQIRNGMAGMQANAEEKLRQWLMEQKSEMSTANYPTLIDTTLSLRSFENWKAEQIVKDTALLNEIRQRLHMPSKGQEDSLLAIYRNSEQDLKNLKNNYRRKLDSVRNKMQDLENLDDLLAMEQLDTTGRFKAVSKLKKAMMRTGLRAGKLLVNFSNLTVNNIFLYGARVRYGDKYFVEAAAGTYDFAFRSFFRLQSDSFNSNRPYVMAVKLGKMKEGNSTALTFYTGKKSVSGSLNNAMRQVSGLALEKHIDIGRNWKLEAELAKSTERPTTVADGKLNGWRELFTRFRRETFAAHAQFSGQVGAAGPDVELAFQYWGTKFESFNATQVFNPQNQLRLQMKQAFWKRRVNIAAGARYSDFKTTGIENNLRSRTLFLSSSIVLRIPSLPVISLGYYPGTQLYWMKGDRLYEYYYRILNATISHQFRLASASMQLTGSFNRFQNEYKDSLVSPPQNMMSIFWSAWKGPLTYSLNASRQQTEEHTLDVLEAGMAWAGKWLRLGGSLKWNKVAPFIRWAGSLNVGIGMGRFGTLSCLFDKSYFPGRSGDFIPVTMGQLQFIKPLNFTIWR